MRKDVKFGFAIGGVLLAVLIVYVLVVPNTDKNGNQVADIGAAPSPTQSPPTPSNSSGGTASSSVTKVETPKPLAPTPAETPHQTVTPTEAAKADPFATSSNDQKPAVAENSVASGESRGVDWAKLLDGAPMPPPLLSKTSTDDKTSSSASSSSNDSVAGADRSPREGSSTSLMALSGGVSTSGSSPATQPSTGQRTHVIAAHETLSSISAAAYGNASHWKEIAAANPNINPNKLKRGVTIVLPALDAKPVAKEESSSSKSSSAVASSSGSSPTPIDSTHEYRVQKNDTLYTISIKLYGKADRVDKIYELNKEAIGPNRDHLKLNSVLKLPEAPSVASR